MADEQIKIELDPRKVLDGMKSMAKESQDLSRQMEESLGKNSTKSIKKLEDAAENGAAKISTFFRNLTTRVREDLKTAFDATGVLAGAKFAKDLGEGVKQVFEMERAFDRLNTRLQLTAKQLDTLKSGMGKAVAATGQEIESILPGVEVAAAKGQVKAPEQLTAIAEMLGQARATTGEDVTGLSDTIVEIIKNQGQQVNAKTYKATMDALQATRVKGSFETAGEAGHAIQDLSKYGKQFGVGTRELGGMAAVAGRAGSAGQDILKQLFEQASGFGGGSKLNALFGQDVFKLGKEGQATGVNAAALGKIDMKKYGAYSQQVLEETTGLKGAAGADLGRFVDAFKNGMDDFNKVISGSNETATQFGAATQNLASKLDQFKEGVKNSGREIGESVSGLANDVLSGNFKKIGSDLKNVGAKAWDNKGSVAAALGLTAGIGVLAGGGLGRLLSKVPGGGVLGGMAMGQAAKAAGIQPVYVTNAKEIASSNGPGSAAWDWATGTVAGGAAGKLGKFGQLGKMALGGLASAAPVAGAVAAGAGIGYAVNQIPGVSQALTFEPIVDMLESILGESPDEELKKQGFKIQEGEQGAFQNMTPEQIESAVTNGFIKGHQSVGNKKPDYTNPSAYPSTGGSK